MAIGLRHRVGVAALELEGDEQVLEIGCGPGVATRLLAKALPRGRVVALDQSAKAIAQLTAGASDEIAAGRIVPRTAALEDAGLAPQSFDAILAINVDLNRRLGDRWPRLLARFLKPSGRLVLAFEAPPGSRNGDLFTRNATAALTGFGFSVSETRHDEDGQSVTVLHAVST
ncbi:Methyltransferase domain-containing protein [Devosia enhydra]|uniref:Methyltransferase domain-containing protein n=1 Tax=Devosia enhydra TaxID=665118 RepID=A0A1K2I0G3_9HYPH|nr:class I SAM-dependent methyltransferase [Devosia enhydra]SFZ85174.1 Methyltransferase domain-containing protein [Devosia enhydra]